MNQFLSTISNILASVFFFLTIVVVGSIVGSKYLMDQDARDVLGGDTPHSFFRVLVLDKEDKMTSMSLEELAQPQLGEQRLYPWLPIGKGEYLEGTKIRYQYEVTRKNDQLRQVEINFSDSDRSAVWRYEVSPGTVTPVYSKVTSLSYLFQALPFAFIIAFLFNLAGKIIQSRAREANKFSAE